MMYRVVVDIIDMSIQVVLVTNDMLPESVLPHTAGSEMPSIDVVVMNLEAVQYIRYRFSACLNHGMKMVWEDNPRVELSAFPRLLEDFRSPQEDGLALKCNHSHKEGRITDDMSAERFHNEAITHPVRCRVARPTNQCA